MSFESDPAGLGVGKTYGPQGLYAAGVVKTDGVHNEAVFELDTSVGLRATYTLVLPSRCLITEVTSEVEVAFSGTDAGYFVQIAAGGTPNSTEYDLDATGIRAEVLTGISPLFTVDFDPADLDASTLIITPDAAAIGSATGRARVVVTYKKV